MAYTTINKGSDYFNTVLYTGNGTTNNITVGFQPDFVWIKNRDVGTANHCLMDVVRGFGTGSSDTPLVNSNTTDAEFNRDVFSSTGITSTGYELDTYVDTNANTQNFASWNWLAGGTASSNTDGSITSSVSANTTSGFSIVSYSGNSSSATVGHGLGVAPKMIIIKHRNGVDDWTCYHSSLGSSQRIQLNSTGAASALSWGGDPTSSVFYLLGGGATAVNVTGGTYIAYCFADVKGFSKFGSYTGNGSADGPFIYTGFKPAMVIIKASSATGEWLMYDNKRSPFNETRLTLSADNSDAEEEVPQRKINMVSNGFEIASNSAYTNSSGQTYIYMAFAENPLVTTGKVPATAR